MTARFFIVVLVLAISLVLGEGGTPRPPLNSLEYIQDESDREPIKQVQMERLHKAPEEQWTAIASQKTPSTFNTHEEVLSHVDSPSLSPSLEIAQENALSSAASDHTPVEPTANMLEVENISEDSIVQATFSQGAGLARVLQDLGMTEENSTVLDTLGPDFHGDLNHMTFNEIMAALDEAKKMEAWEEEKEAWKKVKDQRLEEIGAYNDGYNGRVHTYPSDDKYLEEWEKWLETSVENAQQEDEFELLNYHQHFLLTFFMCPLIVAALVIVIHQCYIERKLKRRVSVEMQDSALPVKQPLMQPMLVIVPQQLAGKQQLY